MLRCSSELLSFMVRWCTATAREKKINLEMLKMLKSELFFHESSYSSNINIWLFNDRHARRVNLKSKIFNSLKTVNGERWIQKCLSRKCCEILTCISLFLCLLSTIKKKLTIKMISYIFKRLTITNNKVSSKMQLLR